MDSDAFSIVVRLAVLAGVMLAGWYARRRAWLGDPATRALSRLSTDVLFPCLSFTHMLRIVGLRPPMEQAALLLIGALLLGIAIAIAWALLHDLPPAARRTAWLASALPNWIFLPLPIAALVYGADGIATVLLVNVTAQFFLWSGCVALLRGVRKTLRDGLVHALNPGLLATAAGAALAALWPESRGWFDRPGPVGHLLGLIATAGTLTIPLSLLVTGSQLGALPSGWRIDAPLRRVIAARLLIAPAASVLALAALARALPLPADVWRAATLIAAMPTALSCGVLVERYGGDRDLASRAILATTIGALATVPLFMLAARAIFR
jgi:predicted permease